MKFLALFALFAVAAAGHRFNPEFNEHWENFKEVYGKRYSGSEETSRRIVWEKRVNDIIQHNLRADMGFHSYKRGINEFADMEHGEFVSEFNGFKGVKAPSAKASKWVPPQNDAQLPDTVDWRDKGLVTPVKNQQQCGSCWAFSSTGCLEGQHMKRTGKMVSLSEQNLVDCSRAEGNQGCNGGWMTQAFEYIRRNHGIDTEQSYPYNARDGTCHFNKAHVGATVKGFVNIPSGNEQALKQAVATIGPIAVAIDASHESFQTYQSGIYDEPDCTTDQLDHAVLAVGYGTEDGHDYWLVKNSWGTTWGTKGYIKMLRNTNNQCGIATKASYPLL